MKGRFKVKNARAEEDDEEEKKKKKKAPYCALENVYSMELALRRTLGRCFPCTKMLWTCGFKGTYDAIAAQLTQKASPPSQSCLLHQHFVPEIQCPTLLLCLSGLLFYTTPTTLAHVSSFEAQSRHMLKTDRHMLKPHPKRKQTPQALNQSNIVPNLSLLGNNETTHDKWRCKQHLVPAKMSNNLTLSVSLTVCLSVCLACSIYTTPPTLELLLTFIPPNKSQPRNSRHNQGTC